jgi:hypothetical protein
MEFLWGCAFISLKASLSISSNSIFIYGMTGWRLRMLVLDLEELSGYDPKGPLNHRPCSRDILLYVIYGFLKIIQASTILPFSLPLQAEQLGETAIMRG